MEPVLGLRFEQAWGCVSGDWYEDFLRKEREPQATLGVVGSTRVPLPEWIGIYRDCFYT